MATIRAGFVAIEWIVCFALTNGESWQILKEFNMGEMSAIRADWQIELHPAGWANREFQVYVDSEETIFTRNGNLVIRAFRRDGEFFSGRLHSKSTFSPADHTGKKLKVEFRAKFPTIAGAWPALWMLGEEEVYGGGTRDGEIDVMEWAHELDHRSQSSMHWRNWAPGSPLSVDFEIGRAQMKNNFNTYGVEYSNHVDDEYVQFYVTISNGTTLRGPKWDKDQWIWTDFPPCAYAYTAEASRCSFLAPFDNQMMLLLNVAVGGSWGDCCGVEPSDYDAFDEGVEMEVSGVTVYYAADH